MSFLSPTEINILRWLSRNWSYAQIIAHYHQREKPMTPSTLHVHCHHIRQKTGIGDTKNPQECRDYLRHASARPLSHQTTYKPSPTRAQMEVLRLLATGKSYGEIGLVLKINHQTAQNHASHGCRRAGITNQGHGRTQAIRDYLARQAQPTPSPMDDPLF